MEIREIRILCRKANDPGSSTYISEKEVSSAIRSLNKGKSPDIYNICAEHLSYGADAVIPILTKLLNIMWQLGTVPDSQKLGVQKDQT